MECGAPARTRLAPTPNWQLPTVALGALMLVAGALFAFAFVKLTGDDDAPAATTATPARRRAPVVPPASTTPAPVTTTPTAPLTTPTATTPTTTTPTTATPGATTSTTKPTTTPTPTPTITQNTPPPPLAPRTTARPPEPQRRSADAVMAEISIDLLGPVRTTVDGVELALGGGKQRGVLAMLALQVNRMVSTDRLIEGLWAPDLPPSAGKMVHVYISRLRKALGRCGAQIVTHGSGYELRLPGNVLDLVRFERLLAAGAPRDALGLWRGPALADVAGEPFAAIEIARLEELRLQATESAIEADIAGGRVGAAVAELDALVSEHPLREHLQALRLLALYRAGRQADALEHYRTVRQGLIDEARPRAGPGAARPPSGHPHPPRRLAARTTRGASTGRRSATRLRCRNTAAAAQAANALDRRRADSPSSRACSPAPV